MGDWHLARRREMGIYVAIDGQAWHLVYELEEIRIVNGRSEWRNRIDRSRSLYATEAHPMCEQLAQAARDAVQDTVRDTTALK